MKGSRATGQKGGVWARKVIHCTVFRPCMHRGLNDRIGEYEGCSFSEQRIMSRMVFDPPTEAQNAQSRNRATTSIGRSRITAITEKPPDLQSAGFSQRLSAFVNKDARYLRRYIIQMLITTRENPFLAKPIALQRCAPRAHTKARHHRRYLPVAAKTFVSNPRSLPQLT